jgi:hypothetical protein
MFAESAEHKMQQTNQCLRGVTLALVTGGEGDADLHLPGIVFSAMKSAIAHHELGRPLDNGQLEPRARNTWLLIALSLDEPGGIGGPKGFPVLVTSYLRQRSIAAQLSGIAVRKRTQ